MRQRVIFDTLHSSDSDHQTQSILSVDYRQLRPAFHNLGWESTLGNRELSSVDGSERFDFLRMKGSIDAWAGTTVSAEVSQLFADSWSPTLGATELQWQLSPIWLAAASLERDLVDTVVAVNQQILIDTVAASLDWSPNHSLTMVAGLAQSAFSDGNNRTRSLLRAIYTPATSPWLNAQLRLRHTASDATGIGYFNPSQLEDYLFSMRAAGSPFSENWRLSLQAGVGLQRIDNLGSSTIYSIDGRIRGWFSERYGLESQVLCSNVGSLSGTSASQGYRYCQGGLSLIIAW